MCAIHLAFLRNNKITIMDIGERGEWLGAVYAEFPSLKHAERAWRVDYDSRHRRTYPLVGEDATAWYVYPIE